jgi:hypothetical protein
MSHFFAWVVGAVKNGKAEMSEKIERGFLTVGNFGSRMRIFGFLP